MIGRATRLCPEIGKERFRIFEAARRQRLGRDLVGLVDFDDQLRISGIPSPK
jgi:hypothetical protein